MSHDYTGTSAGVHSDEDEQEPARLPKATVGDDAPDANVKSAPTTKPTPSADRGPDTTTRGIAGDPPDRP